MLVNRSSRDRADTLKQPRRRHARRRRFTARPRTAITRHRKRLMMLLAQSERTSSYGDAPPSRPALARSPRATAVAGQACCGANFKAKEKARLAESSARGRGQAAGRALRADERITAARGRGGAAVVRQRTAARARPVSPQTTNSVPRTKRAAHAHQRRARGRERAAGGHSPPRARAVRPRPQEAAAHVALSRAKWGLELPARSSVTEASIRCVGGCGFARPTASARGARDADHDAYERARRRRWPARGGRF